MGPGFEFSINLRYMLDKCIGATVTTKKHSYICIKDQKHIRKIKTQKLGKPKKTILRYSCLDPPKSEKNKKQKKPWENKKHKKTKKTFWGSLEEKRVQARVSQNCFLVFFWLSQGFLVFWFF